MIATLTFWYVVINIVAGVISVPTFKRMRAKFSDVSLSGFLLVVVAVSLSWPILIVQAWRRN